MTDQQAFERSVAESVRSVGPVPASSGAHELTLSRVRHSRQDPEWLALIKESPMRTNSRVTVGSPTVRVAAILVATMMLALALAAAGAGAQKLLAAGGPIIVAQDGSGDYTTITEAVAAAADGNEIRVRPGTYVESVRVNKDLILAGDGDPTSIILDHSIDSPTIAGPAPLGYSELQYGLLLDDADATVRGLTLLARGVAIAIEGGAPSIEGVLIDDPVQTDEDGEAVGDEPVLWESGAIVVERGAAPTISELVTDGWIYVGTGALHLADSRVANHVYLGDGSDSTIRGSEVAHVTAYLGSVRTIIEDNDFTGSRWPAEAAQAIYLAINAGSDVTIAGNRIGDPTYDTAVLVSGSGGVAVLDNHIHDSGTGLRFDTGSRADLHVAGNDLAANGYGLAIADHGGSVTVEDNTITGNGTGLFLSGPSDNRFEGNRVCQNETNVLLAVGADPPDSAANDVCEDDPAG